MHRGKYGAVIGLTKPIACIFILDTYKKRVFRPITGLYFPLYIKPRIFAKRQCKVEWLTPPTLWGFVMEASVYDVLDRIGPLV
jgi:hypothetical protein